jgi:hypothetical protein
MFKKFLFSPLTVIAMIPLGVFLGDVYPSESQNFAFLGYSYLSLLKLAVLPYLLTTILIGITSLLQQEESSLLIKRIVFWFAISSIVASLIGLITFLEISTGITQEQHLAFGNLVNSAQTSSDLEISLTHPDPELPSITAGAIFEKFIPDNIFANLTTGDNLKVVIFALIFGVALSKTNGNGVIGLLSLAKTIQSSCSLIFNWINYFLPFALLAMIASQVGSTGLAIFETMIDFVKEQMVASIVLVIISICVLMFRCRTGFLNIIACTQQSLFIAISSRSTAISMPSAKNGLAALGLKYSNLEFVIPISFTLNRLGAILYFTISAMFVMNLYGVEFTASGLLIIVIGSLIAALASAGLSGALTVATLGLVCELLKVPSEVAIILLIAIDPFTDITRTVCTVYGNLAVTSLIASKEVHIQNDEMDTNLKDVQS